jgi:hypothetical protein
MSTVQETLIPASMVPGLVTIEDGEGNRKNVYPIDAKELLASGEFTLVENGAIEASRMAATPLRSGYASGIPSEQIIAEISGVEGRILAAADEDAAAEVKEAGDSPDANREPSAVPAVGYTAMQDASGAANMPPAEEGDKVEHKGAAARARGDDRGGKPTQMPAQRTPASSGIGGDKKDDDKR